MYKKCYYKQQCYYKQYYYFEGDSVGSENNNTPQKIDQKTIP